MNPTLDAIVSEAKRLPKEEQVELLDRLCVELDVDPDPEVERAWIEEAERRVDAYERGEIKALDGATFFSPQLPPE